MTSYIDHSSRGGNQHWQYETHSWQEDCLRRIAWLYGDPESRITANAPDLESWRRLGTRRAA